MTNLERSLRLVKTKWILAGLGLLVLCLITTNTDKLSYLALGIAFTAATPFWLSKNYGFRPVHVLLILPYLVTTPLSYLLDTGAFILVMAVAFLASLLLYLLDADWTRLLPNRLFYTIDANRADFLLRHYWNHYPTQTQNYCLVAVPDRISDYPRLLFYYKDIPGQEAIPENTRGLSPILNAYASFIAIDHSQAAKTWEDNGLNAAFTLNSPKSAHEKMEMAAISPI